jgi:PAT family beta-lactamase induction signal transducer AmpG
MTASPRRRYRLRDYLNRRVLTMLALGFSSGLPFNLVGNTLGYWLADEHTTLSAIGFISWVGLAYSLKFVFAPLLDRTRVPVLGKLGRRRGWILFTQILVAAGLIAMAIAGTRNGLVVLGAIALAVAFSAATQDTAVDAWRIESATSADDLGLLTSSYTFGYRSALLGTEAIILPIAQRLGWNASYAVYGVLIGIGIIACFCAHEPEQADRVMESKRIAAPISTSRGIFDAIAGPFVAFFKAHGVNAILMLLAISLFQLPNFVSGPMYNPMYVYLGLSKDMVGAVRGSFGLVGVFLGVATGGYLSLRLGLLRAVMVGCLGQMLGTALYAIVPYAHDPATFAVIMVLDNFAIAMAGVTLVAYMSSLTSLGYTATQYALLSSTYTWAGKILKGFSGLTVDTMAAHIGRTDAYVVFFAGCGLIGVPALLLFAFLARRLGGRPELGVNPA